MSSIQTHPADFYNMGDMAHMAQMQGDDVDFRDSDFEWHGRFDRRRSDRISVSIPVRLEDLEGSHGLEGAELVNLVELSLGGATLETASRPQLHVPRRLSLCYGGVSSELTVRPYQCCLRQLFYAPSRSSQVLFRVRVTFEDPSVAALNLLYRILLAHWDGAEG